jgi:hypothetical protein
MADRDSPTTHRGSAAIRSNCGIGAAVGYFGAAPIFYSAPTSEILFTAVVTNTSSSLICGRYVPGPGSRVPPEIGRTSRAAPSLVHWSRNLVNSASK